jgi:hypothetical protein
MRHFGARYPIRLAGAIGLSVLTQMSGRVWKIMDAESQLAVLIAETEVYIYFAMIAPLCFLSIVLKGNGAPESAVHQVNTIDLIMQRAKLSQHHCTLIWKKLLEKYVEAAKPDLSKQPDLMAAFEEAKDEVLDQPPSTL